jgi:hypothetical protein
MSTRILLARPPGPDQGRHPAASSTRTPVPPEISTKSVNAPEADVIAR